MGLRESLQKNPAVTTGVAVVLIVLALVFIYFQLSGPSRPSAAALNKTFYSDDDGATFFLDDSAKVPPFDHNGKQAYRALVFRCSSGGKLFVGYLQKVPDDRKAQAESIISTDPKNVGQALAGMDARKPGEKTWVTGPKASEMTSYPKVNCPDGGGAAILAAPTDPDAIAAAK